MAAVGLHRGEDDGGAEEAGLEPVGGQAVGHQGVGAGQAGLADRAGGGLLAGVLGLLGQARTGQEAGATRWLRRCSGEARKVWQSGRGHRTKPCWGRIEVCWREGSQTCIRRWAPWSLFLTPQRGQEYSKGAPFFPLASSSTTTFLVSSDL